MSGEGNTPSQKDIRDAVEERHQDELFGVSGEKPRHESPAVTPRPHIDSDDTISQSELRKTLEERFMEEGS
jgi:hypothetical protein